MDTDKGLEWTNPLQKGGMHRGFDEMPKILYTWAKITLNHSKHFKTF